MRMRVTRFDMTENESKPRAGRKRLGAEGLFGRLEPEFAPVDRVQGIVAPAVDRGVQEEALVAIVKRRIGDVLRKDLFHGIEGRAAFGGVTGRVRGGKGGIKLRVAPGGVIVGIAGRGDLE